MTEAFRAITNAQPVSIDMTGAELRYETAANGSAVAVARFQGGRTVMGFGGNAESIAKNGTVRGVAILSRGALKIVGRAVFVSLSHHPDNAGGASDGPVAQVVRAHP